MCIRNDIIITILLYLKYISFACIRILSSLKNPRFCRILIQLCPDPDLVVSISNAINFFLSMYYSFYLFRCIYLYLPLFSLFLSFPPCRPANCTGNSNGEIWPIRDTIKMIVAATGIEKMSRILGMGCLNIFWVKGKKTRGGGRTYLYLYQRRV